MQVLRQVIAAASKSYIQLDVAVTAQWFMPATLHVHHCNCSARLEHDRSLNIHTILPLKTLIIYS